MFDTPLLTFYLSVFFLDLGLQVKEGQFRLLPDYYCIRLIAAECFLYVHMLDSGANFILF